MTRERKRQWVEVMERDARFWARSNIGTSTGDRWAVAVTRIARIKARGGIPLCRWWSRRTRQDENGAGMIEVVQLRKEKP